MAIICASARIAKNYHKFYFIAYVSEFLEKITIESFLGMFSNSKTSFFKRAEIQQIFDSFIVNF